MTCFRALPLRIVIGASALLVPRTSPAGPDGGRSIERYDVGSAPKPVCGARALVRAPSNVARSVVTDYGRYDAFISRFRDAKIVGKVGKQTDVYLTVPIMNGTVKIWAVVRFQPPRKEGTDEVIVGKLVQGNVKRLNATWRLHPVDGESTRVNLELSIVPQLPLPQSLLRPELCHAAEKALSGARREAERRGKRP
jgi:ribosome-associated toxin RatA of RatAB toxin-antitoxin module